MKALHTLQRWLAALLVAAVAAQFLLAGAGAFGATSFKPHTGLGWAIAVVSLILLLVALAGRRHVRASAILFATVVVQVLLGVLGENASAWFGAVHGLNALLVMGAAVNLARRTAPDRGARSAGVPPSPGRHEVPSA
ncbi:MAG: DUF6220 domain-containing protein [Solirubrobacteraceae bacterium]